MARRCMVCGLALEEGEEHRWDRQCVEALRLENRRLARVVAMFRRALSGAWE